MDNNDQTMNQGRTAEEAKADERNVLINELVEIGLLFSLNEHHNRSNDDRVSERMGASIRRSLNEHRALSAPARRISPPSPEAAAIFQQLQVYVNEGRSRSDPKVQKCLERVRVIIDPVRPNS